MSEPVERKQLLTAVWAQPPGGHYGPQLLGAVPGCIEGEEREERIQELQDWFLGYCDPGERVMFWTTGTHVVSGGVPAHAEERVSPDPWPARV